MKLDSFSAELLLSARADLSHYKRSSAKSMPGLYTKSLLRMPSVAKLLSSFLIFHGTD